MRVRCIANSGKTLPQNYIDSTAGYSSNRIFEEITLGKEYTVYVFTSWKGETWYYIDDDAGRYYPSTYPAPLFEVSDSRLSAYWRIRVEQTETRAGIATSIVELAFEEWFADPYFFDKLTDQNEAEVKMFRQIKARMEAETR